MLIEEKVGDYFIGYTKNYIRTYVKCDSMEDLTNEVVQVKLDVPYKDGAKGTIL